MAAGIVRSQLLAKHVEVKIGDGARTRKEEWPKRMTGARLLPRQKYQVFNASEDLGSPPECYFRFVLNREWAGGIAVEGIPIVADRFDQAA